MANRTSEFDGQVIEGEDGVNDILTAQHKNVTLVGLSGDDQLFSTTNADGTIMQGGAGFDTLDGREGANDTASYIDAPTGVTVDLFVEEIGGELLGFGVAFNDGYGTLDALHGIENLIGSDHDDSLTGDVNANVLQGGAGNDTLTGDGGADADVFKYSFDFTAGGGETSSFTQFFADHGGTVVGGEVADGTKQGQFSSLYTQWLESLGLTVRDLGQNSGSGGMPVVEGPDGTFGERENFSWTSGSGKKAVTHVRWYSDTWSSGGGEDSVTSDDGFDTIVDFAWGPDLLEFNGLKDLSQEQFESLFAVTQDDVNGDTTTDTTLALADGTWGVTLLDVSGHTLDQFFNEAISFT